jgi:hypothetical protein
VFAINALTRNYGMVNKNSARKEKQPGIFFSGSNVFVDSESLVVTLSISRSIELSFYDSVSRRCS